MFNQDTSKVSPFGRFSDLEVGKESTVVVAAFQRNAATICVDKGVTGLCKILVRVFAVGFVIR